MQRVRREMGFWQKAENQRQFLISFAQKYNVINPKAWGGVTKDQISKEGGISLLNIYGCSVYKTLQHVFKGANFLNFIIRNRMETRVVFELARKTLWILETATQPKRVLRKSCYQAKYSKSL